MSAISMVQKLIHASDNVAGGASSVARALDEGVRTTTFEFALEQGTASLRRAATSFDDVASALPTRPAYGDATALTRTGEALTADAAKLRTIADTLDGGSVPFFMQETLQSVMSDAKHGVNALLRNADALG